MAASRRVGASDTAVIPSLDFDVPLRWLVRAAIEVDGFQILAERVKAFQILGLDTIELEEPDVGVDEVLIEEVGVLVKAVSVDLAVRHDEDAVPALTLLDTSDLVGPDDRVVQLDDKGVGVCFDPLREIVRIGFSSGSRVSGEEVEHPQMERLATLTRLEDLWHLHDSCDKEE
jgi:hypothetical protein